MMSIITRNYVCQIRGSFQAAKRGMAMFSHTDHDCVSGFAEILRPPANAGAAELSNSFYSTH